MSRRPGWIQAIDEMLRKGLAVPEIELREDDKDSTGKMTYTPSGRLQIPVAFLSDQAEYYLASLCA